MRSGVGDYLKSRSHRPRCRCFKRSQLIDWSVPCVIFETEVNVFSLLPFLRVSMYVPRLVLLGHLDFDKRKAVVESIDFLF